MKSEAPEKIHVQPNAHDRWFEGKIPSGLPDGLFVEYTRTDSFIEKACEWLKENFSFDEAGYCKTNIYSTESMIYNFKNTLEDKL